MILQNFDLRLADPSYELKIKQTFTINPDGLKYTRNAVVITGLASLNGRLFGGPAPKRPAPQDVDILSETKTLKAATNPLIVLYGSNTGTYEGLAQSLANRAVAHGFTAKISTMNSAWHRSV